METKNNDETVDDNTNSKNSDGETSFVSKVRHSVSGLFNSSISKLFGNQERPISTTRRRGNDNDIQEEQPPCKKIKSVDNNLTYNNIPESSFLINKPTYSTNSVANVSRPIFTNYGEPVAGPSGMTAQKLYERTLTNSSSAHTEISNDEKCSESGDSTSGYSSFAKLCNKRGLPISEPKESLSHRPAKVSHDFNQSVGNNSGSRSLFNNMDKSPATPIKSLFGSQNTTPQMKNTSLSSRKPSFNSSHFIDRTIATSRIMNSPFYNGPTIYGGASAYAREVKQSRRAQLKNSFLVKPVNKTTESNTCTSLSKTARRILNTLEQYTTPLGEGRKTPFSKSSENQTGLCSRYIGANPYSRRKGNISSSRELQIPTMPELLNMKQKQRLQESTDSIRQIATSSNSSLNTHIYKIPDENQQKHANKLRPKISSIRNKKTDDEIPEETSLKPVEFTLPESNLPKFDLVIPPPDSAKTSNKEKAGVSTSEENESFSVSNPQLSKVKESQKNEDVIIQYNFSKPIVIADNMKSVVAINNFKFSEPLSASRKLPIIHSNVIVVDSKEKKNSEISHDNSSINKDSIMDKFKPPAGSWECSVCLIRNKSEAIQCVACESMRPAQYPKSEVNPILPSFGSQFYKKQDEWECGTCLIRNKIQNVKCVACGSLKPSSTNECNDKSQNITNENNCKDSVSKLDNSSNHCGQLETSSKNSFIALPKVGDAFKKPSSTWECAECWVRNQNNAEKCIACGTKRSKTIPKENFIKTKTTWECDTCLIKNSSDSRVCAACETPKKETNLPLEQAIVKKESSKWECPTCMVRNDNNMSKCPCCETPKPAVTLVSKNTVSMFNFGIKAQLSFGSPKEKVESNIISTESSKLTTPASIVSGVNTSTPTFTFGIKPTNDGPAVAKTEPFVPKPSVNSSTKLESKDKVEFSMPKIGEVSSTPKTSVENTSTGGFQFKLPTSAVNLNPVTNSNGSNAVSFKFGDSSHSEKVVPSGSLFTTPATKVNDVKLTRPISGSKDIVASATPALPSTDGSKFEIVNKSTPTTSSTDKNLFMFGKNNAIPSFNSSGMGNTSTVTPSIKPTFSFGNSTTANAKGFNFTPSASTSKLSAQEGSSSGVAPKQNTYLFPTQSAGNANSKNGGFNFGNASLSNNQAAAFSFGAKQLSTNSTQPTSGGFNFSNSAPTTGGFNFSSSAPSFDANGKPSFNFTGGSTPVFAATPTERGEPVAPVRKFKKAVRRAAQR